MSDGALATSTSFKGLFFTSVSLIGIYTLVMGYGLLWKPRAFKWVLLRITSLSFLRKWRASASAVGNDVMLASNILKGNDAAYWMRAVGSTVFIWCARYFMLNCIMASFQEGFSLSDHVLIFARQIIMWIVMLVSPTPGSTGTAEWSFGFFFRDFLGNFSVAVALFWRLFTYYAYLILGFFFIPRWLRSVLKK